MLMLPASAHASFPGANGKIAFVRSGDIWTMDPDGSSQVNLTHDGVEQGSPSWSADGNRIAYDQLNGSLTQTYTMLADGTNRALADDGDPNIRRREDPAWSPSGTRLVVAGGAAMWSMNPDGTGLA